MQNSKQDLIQLGNWPQLYLNGDSNELNDKVKQSIGNYLNKDVSAGLYLSGQFGTGKSTLIGLIAIWLRTNRMQLVHFDTASNLFDKFIKGENDIKTKQVICIDDFGRQYNTEYSVSKFNEFIEYRYSRNLKTFITSNMQVSDLRTITGFERIADVFLDKKFMFEIKIIGNSKRCTLSL